LTEGKPRLSRAGPHMPRNQKKAISHELSRSKELKIAIVVAVSISILLLASFVWSTHQTAPNQLIPQNGDVPRAAILDGLYDVTPNITLTEMLTNLLSGAGYHVDVYRGTEVTVDLLRNIKGYNVLILRLHSSIHNDGFLYLFTGEHYTESRYVDEQLSGAVKRGYTFNESEVPYFVLNAVFLGSNRAGGLKDSTIMLTGCNGTGSQYTIQRFLEKGVKAYVAWSGYVDLSHSDETVLRLTRAVYAEHLNLKEAVDEVMSEVGPDPFYKSILQCYVP
jgi:hypothetical protein